MKTIGNFEKSPKKIRIEEGIKKLKEKISPPKQVLNLDLIEIKEDEPLKSEKEFVKEEEFDLDKIDDEGVMSPSKVFRSKNDDALNQSFGEGKDQEISEEGFATLDIVLKTEKKLKL